MLVVNCAVVWKRPFPSPIDSRSPRKTISISVRSVKSSFTVSLPSQSNLGKVGFGPRLSPIVSWFAIVSMMHPSVSS